MIISFSVFREKIESGEKPQTIRKYSPGQYRRFLNCWKKRETTGRYTISGLVDLCNDPTLTAERLNHYLANYRENGEWKPFQYKEGKIWRLAPRGLPHGREYPFNLGNGHSEPRISWRESILVAAGLKRPVSEDQVMLPARVV